MKLKHRLLVLFTISLNLLVLLPTVGQTYIKFSPSEKNESLRKKKSDLDFGTLEQFGNSFDGEVNIELPDKNLKLNFQASSIKQYNVVKTSDGETLTDVEVYESKTEAGSNYLITIQNEVYSFIESTENEIYELRKARKDLYSYGALEEKDFDVACLTNNTGKPILDLPKNARAISSLGCYEFPVVFVNDYDHYLNNKNKSIAEIEAKNLSDLAGAQAIWNFSNALQSEIRFKALGQIIETDDTDLLWSRDPKSEMWGRLAYLIEFWDKPTEWDVDYLTIISVTGIHFLDNDINLPGEPSKGTVIGQGSSFFNMFNTGAIVIRGYVDEEKLVVNLQEDATKFLLAHEFGHVFGLGHSKEQSNSIMTSYINPSKTWIPNHIDSINLAVNKVASLNVIDRCPKVYLGWKDEKDGLKFSWTADLVSEQDNFVLEISNDKGVTWQNIGFANAHGEFSMKFLDSEIIYTQFMARMIQKGDNQAISNVVEVDLEILRDIPEKGALVYFDQERNKLVIKSSKPTAVAVYGIDGKLIANDYLKYYFLNMETSSWMPGIYMVKLAALPEKKFKVFVF